MTRAKLLLVVNYTKMRFWLMAGPVPYYIVRNTWGKDWGLDGYVHIKYGDNMCGECH